MCSIRSGVMNLISYPLYRSCLNRFVTDFLSLFNDDTSKSSFVSSSLEFTYFLKFEGINAIIRPDRVISKCLQRHSSDVSILWHRRCHIEKLSLVILSAENFFFHRFHFRWFNVTISIILKFQPFKMEIVLVIGGKKQLFVSCFSVDGFDKNLKKKL